MMKASRYNIFAQLSPTETLVYNTYSGALSKMDLHLAEVIERSNEIIAEGSLSQAEIQMFAEMNRCGYIIDEKIDEVEKVQVEIAKQRRNSNQLKLIIAPTLECNFGCPYCFEYPKYEQLGLPVQNAILELLRQKLLSNTVHRVSVVWYGGEPLLEKTTIFELSQELIALCREFNAHYQASIITNGYLIDEDTATKMYQSYIRFAQITVDGPQVIHNQRRFLRSNSQTDTYSRIVEGINILNQKEIRVSVRMNVDMTNQGSIKLGMQELSNMINDKRLTSVYLGHVFSYSHGSASEICLSKEEFFQYQMECSLELKKLGFNQAIRKLYPKLRLNYCSAPLDNVFVIGPSGHLFKCWNDICENEFSVGTIQEYIDGCITTAGIVSWKDYSAIEKEKCKKCALFPICGGGCPREVVHTKRDNICEYTEVAIKDMMRLQYSIRHSEGG